MGKRRCSLYRGSRDAPGKSERDGINNQHQADDEGQEEDDEDQDSDDDNDRGNADDWEEVDQIPILCCPLQTPRFLQVLAL